MRPGTVLQFTHDTKRRTRSMTPALVSTRIPKITAVNWDTFFSNENAKLPLNAPVSTQESGKQEYAIQLKILKHQLNKSRFKWSSIESNLNSTKLELHKVENSEQTSLQRLQNSHNKIKYLEDELGALKTNHEFAVLDHDNYIYVKKRMTINKVFLDIKANKLRSKIKNFNEVLKEQEQRLIHVWNNNGKTFTKLKGLVSKVDDEEKWRDLVSQKMNKEVEAKNEHFDRRDEMQRRRIDIIESVANEDKNQRSNFLREGLLLHRTWSQFLAFKQRKENSKFSFMERAHGRIKALTGLSDVGEVVQKILTREQSYTSLMNMILESKKVCERYYEKNVLLENEMDEISMKFTHAEPEKEGFLKTKIQKAVKNVQRSSEKLNKVKFVKKFVEEWVRNMLKKIGGTALEGCAKDLFVKLKQAVHARIKKYERIDVPIVYSPIIKGKKVFDEDVLNFSELVYVEDESSESSPHFDRMVRRRNTKKT